MKKIILCICLLSAMGVSAQEVEKNYIPKQPPILVEAFGGQNSSMYQMVVSKQIAPGSKFGFFSLLSFEENYAKFVPDSYVIQSLFTYNISKRFNVGAGASQKKFGGFKPIVSASYSIFNRNIGFLIQPNYELDKEGNAEIFSMFEWHPINDKKIQPYLRVQGLTSFRNEHSFSYIYLRAGIQHRIFRVGPAFNVQFTGASATSYTNFGGFINILID